MRLENQPSPAGAYSNGVRRHPRTMFSVPITLDRVCEGGARSARGISLDISEGGLGALVQTSLRVGETVEIHLPLPKHYLTAIAVVRYCSKQRSGFEFVGLTADERSHIVTASTPQLPAVW
jgi:PilZ domain-containing protein